MNGKCLIVSAPSGAGKTTLVHHLLEQDLGLEFSISACSRSPRGKEQDGKDYYFLGVEGFRQRISKDAFLEWEEVYPDQYYGTLKSEVERIWKQGKHVIFDVDVVGGLNLKNQFGEQAMAVFIQPPNEAALEARLRSRQTESEEKINLRLKKAGEELAFATRFDRVIVNDDLKVAQKEIESVVAAFLAP
ncbi:MAG: guanylate kinase [Salibacteraceae bacterium]